MFKKNSAFSYCALVFIFTFAQGGACPPAIPDPGVDDDFSDVGFPQGMDAPSSGDAGNDVIADVGGVDDAGMETGYTLTLNFNTNGRGWPNYVGFWHGDWKANPPTQIMPENRDRWDISLPTNAEKFGLVWVCVDPQSSELVDTYWLGATLEEMTELNINCYGIAGDEPNRSVLTTEIDASNLNITEVRFGGNGCSIDRGQLRCETPAGQKPQTLTVKQGTKLWIERNKVVPPEGAWVSVIFPADTTTPGTLTVNRSDLTFSSGSIYTENTSTPIGDGVNTVSYDLPMDRLGLDKVQFVASNRNEPGNTGNI